MCIWCPPRQHAGRPSSAFRSLITPLAFPSCFMLLCSDQQSQLYSPPDPATCPDVVVICNREWNAYVDGIGTCCIYTWNTIQESQFDNAVSFVVLHISYGGCSYPNYYKWRAKEQCLSSVHSGGGWLCSCCCHTQSWCHTSPSFVDLINCNNNKKGQRSLSTVIKVRIKYIETTDFAKGWLYIQFNGVNIEPKSTCYKKERNELQLIGFITQWWCMFTVS